MFFKDSFHLIEEGNVKLSKSITNSIALTNNIYISSNTSKRYLYSDNCKNKVLAHSPYSKNCNSFLLNERNFPRFSNVFHSISSISELRLHQRKPDCNVKLISVHESPVYTSSVSELVKPLKISKRVCSSNSSKRNVWNASSVSQRTKSLDVSKPVCPSKTTKRKVYNTSNVSSFTTSLNVSKPVCSSKTTKRKIYNTCNVS